MLISWFCYSLIDQFYYLFIIKAPRLILKLLILNQVSHCIHPESRHTSKKEKEIIFLKCKLIF